MKKIYFRFSVMILMAIFCLSAFAAKSQDFLLTSPNGNLEMKVSVNKGISWSLLLNREVVIAEAKIDMDFGNGQLAGSGEIISHQLIEKKSIIKPEVPYKDAEITDHFNELTLAFNNGIKLHFRTYKDGVAYCFEDDDVNRKFVFDEQLHLNFPEGAFTYFPEEKSMYSHNERIYTHAALKDIAEGCFCSLPVMFETAAGAKVVLTETALHDYPNMFLKMIANEQFRAIFPKFVLEAIPNVERGPDRNQIITREADYIAEMAGARSYPWRVFIVSNDDREFIKSSLAYQLAEPSVLENTSWIKPGKVAWDWYNANNIFGVDFRSGLNTDTYNYYIDFAAANGVEYVIFDEGWTKSTTEILDFNPEMDVKGLINHASGKGVGIILWVLWKPLSENPDEILETYKSWGAKGIKVDFMQRSDQAMVTSYESIAAKAAQLELLVNFHGAFKPGGLQRKYPNVLNFEGVKGGENNKWSDIITPDHNLTIPFIRMAAGPMDYTPGSMINANKANYAISWERPISLGTRCHQVAMFVIYEAPLQMMCESPSVYLQEQECTDFISQIPTTWDETIVLKAKVADYLILARRKGNDWYIAGMTDWTPRTFEIPLYFLTGTYEATLLTDGINADRFAQDYKLTKQNLTLSDTVTINMKPGGGFAAILRGVE
ncbi:MAG: glycoside hydrolase family 97 protein [Bacteroidales bacterium]|nr:glycoside hydrolase family 97 protein [Bacteroidales bacterium]